jgi:lipooligosaccharide transport system permease protein
MSQGPSSPGHRDRGPARHLPFLPNGVTMRTFQVWRRNWDVYLQTWRINFLPPVLEPVFYLLAFGAGLGALVGTVQYRGDLVGYTAFIAPGLIAISAMNSAFFENTYSSFVRMYYQKTFDALMATPLVLEEVVLGEILWGATASLLGAGIMLAVVAAFGLLQGPLALLALPLAALGGLAFGATAMCFTAIVPRIDVFNLPVFLFVTPMFLFGGTFFPLDTLPSWANGIALGLPLTHLARLIRSATLGAFGIADAFSLLYLSVYTAVVLPLAVVLMRRRLVL